MAEPRLRLGILGAARNVPFSVVQPVRDNADLAARLDVVGLASLDQKEAELRAKEWGLAKSFASFEEMLADPNVEVVYNVLPIAVRCQWTVRALLAGKHVLSETPICNNAQEAMLAQRAAEDMGKILLEGTHPTAHPITKRVREMIFQGKIGILEHVDLDLSVSHALQGGGVCSKTGALMSLGCHAVAIVRALLGEEPRVVSASVQRSKENPDVDTSVSCNLKNANGVGAHFGCSISTATKEHPTTFTISGSGGTIRCREWFTGKGKSSNEIELEQFDDNGQHFKESIDNTPQRDTFYFQLMNLIDEVRAQEKGQAVGMPWSYTKAKGPADAVLNMALIDAIYKKANMKGRPTTDAPPEPYNRIGRSKL